MTESSLLCGESKICVIMFLFCKIDIILCTVNTPYMCTCMAGLGGGHGITKVDAYSGWCTSQIL